MPNKKRDKAKEQALKVAAAVNDRVKGGVNLITRTVQPNRSDKDEGESLLLDTSGLYEASPAAREGYGGLPVSPRAEEDAVVWEVRDGDLYEVSKKCGAANGGYVEDDDHDGKWEVHETVATAGGTGSHHGGIAGAEVGRGQTTGHDDEVEIVYDDHPAERRTEESGKERRKYGRVFEVEMYSKIAQPSAKSKYGAHHIQIPTKSLGDEAGILVQGARIWQPLENRSFTDADGGLSHIVIGDDSHLCNNSMAFVHVLKSFVGSGVMGVPYAFSMGGIAGGILGMIFVSLISNYCVYLLLVAKAKLGPRANTIGDIGRESMGRFGHFCVELCVILSQMGFCTMYLIFISQNMAVYLAPAGITSRNVVWLVIPMMVLLCWIGSLKLLTPFSVMALSLICFGLAYVVSQAAPLLGSPNPIELYKPESFPIFMGMAIYSFEGIAMAIPIEASMKKPQYFPFIWLGGCTCVTVLYASFGAFVYACYGDDVPPIITLALPPGNMTAAVKVGICFSLILTYPLMMFPVFEIAEGHWAKSLFNLPPAPLIDEDDEDEEVGNRKFVAPIQRDRARHTRLYTATDYFLWRRRLFRLALVLVTAVIASTIPDFGNVMAFIGAFPCNLLAFVLPTLFHAALFWSSMGIVGKAADGLLLLAGIGAVIICTWSAFLGGVKYGGA